MTCKRAGAASREPSYKTAITLFFPGFEKAFSPGQLKKSNLSSGFKQTLFAYHASSEDINHDLCICLVQSGLEQDGFIFLCAGSLPCYPWRRTESQVNLANAAHPGCSSSNPTSSTLWRDIRIDPIRQGCFNHKKTHTSSHQCTNWKVSSRKNVVVKWSRMENAVIW